MNLPLRTGRILPDLTQGSAPIVARCKTQPRRAKDIDDSEMRRLFAEGLDDVQLAAHFGYGIQSVREHRWAMGLRRRRGRASGAILAGGSPRNSRHDARSLAGKVVRMLPFDHPALLEGRTIYPATVAAIEGLKNLLVSGFNSRKIGGTVCKGAWRGFPIFTLTLEERATCPTSCALWRSCYSSAMHMAQRVAHGPAFERRLALEVALLASRYPGGFAVRLHVLGDFYSEAYVALWRDLVERYPNLHVFGFTARIDGDAISRSLARLVVDYWPRCAIRFSNAPVAICATVTIEHPLQTPADAIVCPQQLGKTASCATCALCWSTERRIAFVRH